MKRKLLGYFSTVKRITRAFTGTFIKLRVHTGKMIFFRKFFLKVSRCIIWKRINECLLIFEDTPLYSSPLILVKPTSHILYLYGFAGVYKYLEKEEGNGRIE